MHLTTIHKVMNGIVYTHMQSLKHMAVGYSKCE